VQLEADFEHAKDMFQVKICTGRSMRKYIEFGGIQAQNQVPLIASLCFC